ncbi:MAG: DNA internalization-related competence protein ComEC/Rec2 [Woeseia sp.]|nr:DNA internalization-related competence protein ComEC/Rec2 [Woeseia sp.]NNL53677.1 DNA internalization-related competence protein ComEC/Rec2 [Woeseia sp.]
MLPNSLSAVLGATLCSVLPVLPDRGLLAVLGATACLACCRRSTRIVAAGLAGFIGFAVAAGSALDQRLAPSLHRTKIEFVAQVIDFPKASDQKISLLVATKDPRLPARLRLSWYRAGATPRLGEYWQFAARVRRPRGTRNPGGFDYEGWLHRERIGATGYVLAAQRVEGRGPTRLQLARQRAALRITALLPAGDARAALLAIALGTRQDISSSAWERYASTGTSHLMAISGLHVGLAAAGATLLLWAVGGLLFPFGNIRDRALLAAIAVAALYAALSGLAVPAQRALLMTTCATGYLLARRPKRPNEVLAMTALCVLIVDPLAILSPGFLLSFGAVAILLQASRLSVAHRRPGVMWASAAALRELTRLQAFLLLGMLPFTALTFSRTAWLAPLANLIALPLFSVVTVPAALGGLTLGGPLAALGDGLLWLAWHSLRFVHVVIDTLAALPAASVKLAQSRGIAIVCLLLPPLWVLLPQGFPGRHLAWLAFVAVLIYLPPRPPVGCVDLYTLDVGQGLAAVVRTRHHTLLYDTGPAYTGGSSSAERVVLPFLASIGVSEIDALIVSHADKDHAGGVSDLLGNLQVKKVLAGELLPAVAKQRPCRIGQHWRWDGVEFNMLHPTLPSAGNDSSCVLQIDAGGTRALLTGDIESRVERSLLRANLLGQATLVQVPHHGSATSSSEAFVARLGAEVGIVSSGFENRWGFPKGDVVARWRGAGTRLLSTATGGAIAHRLCANGGLNLLGEYRKDARRYWHDDDF